MPNDPWPGSTPRLEPNLPLAAYYAQEQWHSERIGAVALYCSDGRWGDAFDEFCHRHLRIPRYDRLAIPGGPARLVPGDGDSDALARATFKELDFLVRVHHVEKLVLITHYGCAIYAERLKLQPDECLPSQLNDIRLACATLRTVYPHMVVEGYLAMRRERLLSFHAVVG
jgi:hypothetical protein